MKPKALSLGVSIAITHSFLVTLFVYPEFIDAFVFPKFLVSVFFSFLMTMILILNRKYFVLQNPLNFAAVLLFSLLILWTAFVGSQSPDIHQAFLGGYQRNLGLFFYLILLVNFLFFSLLPSNPDKLFKRFWRLTFLLFVVQVLIGIVQVFGFTLVKSENTFSTVVGSFGNANFYSAFLSYMFVLILVHFFPKSSPFSKIVGAALVLLLLMAMIGNKSFQGPLAGIFGLIVSYRVDLIELIRKTIKGKYRNAFIFSLFVSLIAFAFLFQKVFGQSSTTFRLLYYKTGLKMLFYEPYLGVGPDQFGDYYRRFLTEESASVGTGLADNAHNMFIQIGATTGLIGLLLYCVIAFLISLIALRQSRFSSDSISRVCCAIWFSYLFLNLLSIESLPSSILAWTSAGMLLRLHSTNHSKNDKQFQGISFHNLMHPLVSLVAVVSLISLFASVGLARQHIELTNITRGKEVKAVLGSIEESIGMNAKLFMLSHDKQILYRALFSAASQGYVGEVYRILEVLDFGKFSNDTNLLDLQAQIAVSLDFPQKAYDIRLKIKELDPYKKFNNDQLEMLKLKLSR
jgi:O-antigen ligase